MKVNQRLKRDIEKYKSKLIEKVKRSGIYENFGQAEVRKLWGKYERDYTFRRTTQPIDDFDKWCMAFTGHKP